MPVFLTDIRDWFNNYKLKTILPLFILMILMIILSLGRPEFSLFILLLYLLIISNINGRETWNDVLQAEWIIKIGMGPYQTIFARLMSTAVIGIIHIMILLPVWIFLNIMWGIEWMNLFMLFIIFIFSMMFAVSLTMLGNLLSLHRYTNYYNNREALIGRFLIIFWQLITLIPVLRILNPFSHIFTTGYKINIITCGIFILFYILIIFLNVLLNGYLIKRSRNLLTYLLNISQQKEQTEI